MSAQVQFLLTMAMLAVGSYGWGVGAARTLDRLGSRPQPNASLAAEVTGPLAIAIGAALFLAYGGVLVACNLAYFSALIGWLGVGVLLAIRYLWKRRASFALALGSWRWWSVVVASLLVATIGYGSAIGGPGNAFDDDPAYLYLAQRLLGTGGLIDPFNLRRIVSYNGGEIFQALVLHGSGPQAALGVEWFFFALLAVALIVRQWQRPFAAIVVLLLGLGVVIVHPVGVWANSGPTFSGVALSIAAFELIVKLRPDRAQWKGALLVGVIVAGLLALRYQFVPPVALAAVAGAVVLARGRTFRVLLVMAGSGVLATLGWAIALQRSSGTPLFPVFTGTYNTTFPWADPAFSGTHEFLIRLGGELSTNGWWLQMVAAVVAVVVLARLSNPDRFPPARATAVVVCSSIIGGFLLLIATTKSLSGGALSDIGRYDGPSALAMVLFLIDALWTAATPEVVAVSVPSVDGTDAGSSESSMFDIRMRATFLAVAAVALAVIAFGSNFVNLDGTQPISALRSTFALDLSVTRTVIATRLGYYERWAPFRAQYNNVSRHIPRGAKVLAAVDQPSLLDFSRYSFSTLDIAGGASPLPHIPLLSGERAVIGYLKALGYDGVVASKPTAPGLYNEASWVANETSGIEDYRAETTYYLAWSEVLAAMVHDPGIHRYRRGSIEYLSWRS